MLDMVALKRATRTSLVALAAIGCILGGAIQAQTMAPYKLDPADQIPAVRKEPTMRDGFSLAAVGDLIGPEIPVMGLEEKELGELVAILKKASVAVGNAETPIFDYSDPEIYPAAGVSHPVKPPAIAGEYAQMGFRVLNMAFNHAGDWSPKALWQMKELLNEAGIETIGYGRSLAFALHPAYVNTRYGRISFVGMTTTLGHRGANATNAAGYTQARPGVAALRLNEDGSYNSYDHYALLRAIRFAKDTSDLAVLYVHSHEDPALFQAFYRTAVDAGADAIIATDTIPDHRGIEIYKGVPIFYGLNPFYYAMFELSTPSEDRYQLENMDPRSATPVELIRRTSSVREHGVFNSVIAELKTSGGRFSEIRLVPIELRENAPDWRNGHPRLANAAQGRETLTAIAKASEAYGTKMTIESNVGVIRLPAAGGGTP